MKFRLWRRKSPFSGKDFSALIPARQVGHELDSSGGRAVLLQPRFSWGPAAWWLQRRLGPTKRYVRVPLDPRGTFLWLEMDGERTIEELGAAFGDRFPEDDDSALERICMYLYNLWENRFIYFVNLSE